MDRARWDALPREGKLVECFRCGARFVPTYELASARHGSRRWFLGQHCARCRVGLRRRAAEAQR